MGTVDEKVVTIVDPSDKFRPEKEDFRNYTENNEYFDRVRRTYKEMHTTQSVQFVKQKMAKWCQFNRGEMTIMEALRLLDGLVDESDPDVDVPNSVHAFQTAERIRCVHPDKEWFQLTGLIHDIGKVLAVWGEPQSCVVGDTFPVGCEFSDQIVFGRESFSDNEDIDNPKFNNKLGIYEENCGLRNVLMSWGHDEYLYRVLVNHGRCSLPEEALYMIRFHSFYPWHSSEDYNYLCDEKDMKMLEWIREFNKFDLYSKSDAVPDVDQLIPYYEQLTAKYLPGKIKW